MVYKKVPESKYTSIMCCTVKDFLMASLENVEIADAITPHIATITYLLSEPRCAIVTQIKIDYNLIEVLPAGYCFHIGGKFFKHHENMSADWTPRAFVKYTFMEDRTPYPGPFVQGLFLFLFLPNQHMSL